MFSHAVDKQRKVKQFSCHHLNSIPFSFLLLFGYILLRIPLCEMQSDDINLYDDQTDNWNIFPISDDIATTYGRKNSRVLKVTSQGLGKLTATLSYFSQHSEMKEVVPSLTLVCFCPLIFLLHFYHHAAAVF